MAKDKKEVRYDAVVLRPLFPGGAVEPAHHQEHHQHQHPQVDIEAPFVVLVQGKKHSCLSGGKSLSRPDLVGIRTCFFPTG